MKITAEYAAGFFDGEGCVSAVQHKQWKETWAAQVNLQVSIVNTDPRPLLALQELFGGKVHPRKLHSKHPQWRQTFHWGCPTVQQEKFLRWIRPYCLIKGEQIDMALAFLKTTAAKRSPLPESVIRKRQTLAQALQNVKQWVWSTDQDVR